MGIPLTATLAQDQRLAQSKGRALTYDQNHGKTTIETQDPGREAGYVIYTNFPMDIPDIEELTGEKSLHLVLDEEIYARFRLCHL